MVRFLRCSSLLVLAACATPQAPGGHAPERAVPLGPPLFLPVTGLAPALPGLGWSAARERRHDEARDADPAWDILRSSDEQIAVRFRFRDAPCKTPAGALAGPTDGWQTESRDPAQVCLAQAQGALEGVVEALDPGQPERFAAVLDAVDQAAARSAGQLTPTSSAVLAAAGLEVPPPAQGRWNLRLLAAPAGEGDEDAFADLISRSDAARPPLFVQLAHDPARCNALFDEAASSHTPIAAPPAWLPPPWDGPTVEHESAPFHSATACLSLGAEGSLVAVVTTAEPWAAAQPDLRALLAAVAQAKAAPLWDSPPLAVPGAVRKLVAPHGSRWQAVHDPAFEILERTAPLEPRLHVALERQSEASCDHVQAPEGAKGQVQPLWLPAGYAPNVAVLPQPNQDLVADVCLPATGPGRMALVVHIEALSPATPRLTADLRGILASIAAAEAP
jgi:hypothetical protein